MAVNRDYGYDITAAAYRADRAHDYELSILTGVDSFAYMIRDRGQQHQLLAYRSREIPVADRANWERTFEQIVLADERLRSVQYATVLLGWQTAKQTLVPREFFDPAAARAPLEQLTVVGLDDTVRHEFYHELDAHLVYAAGRDALAAVERRLRVRRTHHPAGGLLVAWGARSRRYAHESVSLCLRGGQLLVAGHRNGRLLFTNGFPYAAAQDVVYYVLLAYQQCGFSATRVPLYLCGEVTRESAVYEQLHGYVEDLRFCAYGAPPAVPAELATLPPHLYFDLLCLG